MIVLTAFCAVAFALIHVFIGKLTFLQVVPRSRWLSFAGGVSVTYVFMHVLPELSEHRHSFAEGLEVAAGTAESWVYLVALAGLVAFYGLERAVKTSRKASRQENVEAQLLWLHISSFVLYNLLVGYLLLHREQPGLMSLLIFAVAMSLHFVVNDYGLREDQQEQYEAFGRWAIAVAVLTGWLLGALVSLPEVVIGFLFAFLAGGVVLNVLKEELPEERESRFLPFALGAALNAVLLLFV